MYLYIIYLLICSNLFSMYSYINYFYVFVHKCSIIRSIFAIENQITFEIQIITILWTNKIQITYPLFDVVFAKDELKYAIHKCNGKNDPHSHKYVIQCRIQNPVKRVTWQDTSDVMGCRTFHVLTEYIWNTKWMI